MKSEKEYTLFITSEKEYRSSKQDVNNHFGNNKIILFNSNKVSFKKAKVTYYL